MTTSNVVRHLKHSPMDALFFIYGYQGRSPCLVRRGGAKNRLRQDFWDRALPIALYCSRSPPFGPASQPRHKVPASIVALIDCRLSWVRISIGGARGSVLIPSAGH